MGGKHSVAVEAFGKALLQIPMIISENAGFDASACLLSVTSLRGK